MLKGFTKKIIAITILIIVFIGALLVFFSDIGNEISPTPQGESLPLVIEYEGIRVNAVRDNIGISEADVLLAFHGTTMDNSRIMEAAMTMLKNTRKIIKQDNIVIISVAYPEEGMLFGDNTKEAEAVLLWTKHRASQELGIQINRIYLIGHSQGGYLVTRLNTMHETDGVIANGVGPIDLSFHCRLVEGREMKYAHEKSKSEVCVLLKQKYGSVFANPTPYTERSLVHFASGYKSRIMFVQGMQDGKVQMRLWPEFKKKVSRCIDCAQYEFLEIENAGHGAAFENDEAIRAINDFLQLRQ